MFINEIFVTESQLEDMNIDWKTFTLFSFGWSTKIMMNGFVFLAFFF